VPAVTGLPPGARNGPSRKRCNSSSHTAVGRRAPSPASAATGLPSPRSGTSKAKPGKCVRIDSYNSGVLPTDESPTTTRKPPTLRAVHSHSRTAAPASRSTKGGRTVRSSVSATGCTRRANANAPGSRPGRNRSCTVWSRRRAVRPALAGWFPLIRASATVTSTDNTTTPASNGHTRCCTSRGTSWLATFSSSPATAASTPPAATTSSQTSHTRRVRHRDMSLRYGDPARDGPKQPQGRRLWRVAGCAGMTRIPPETRRHLGRRVPQDSGGGRAGPQFQDHTLAREIRRHDRNGAVLGYLPGQLRDRETLRGLIESVVAPARAGATTSDGTAAMDSCGCRFLPGRQPRPPVQEH
jgi:hypothetical protein